MPAPERPLLETHERRCPTCGSQRLVPMGRVVAMAELLKEKRWCEACGTACWFVRTGIA